MAELIGSKISLITKSEVRYVGYLEEVNVERSEVTLKNVTVFGTEGRNKLQGKPEAPASANTYDRIKFQGALIKDLEVVATPEDDNSAKEEIFQDPAVIASSSANVNVVKAVPVVPVAVARPVDVPPTTSAPASQVKPDHKKEISSREKPKPHSFSEAVKAENKRPKDEVNREDKQEKNLTQTRRDKNHHDHAQGTKSSGNSANEKMKDEKEKAIPGMGKHLLFRRFKGLTDDGKKRLKDEVKDDFDFESMNTKFKEIQVEHQHEVEEHRQPNANLDETEDSTPKYNGKTSFWDEISSDVLDRQQGKDTRLTRNDEKKLNTETFGAVAVSDNRHFSRRGGHGHDRGRGSYRGRGRGNGRGSSINNRGSHFYSSTGMPDSE